MTLPKNFSVDKIKEDISRNFSDSILVKKKVLDGDLSELVRIARTLIICLEKKGKVIVFGNGGSAADSLHIVAELAGRFERDRRPLAAIALTSNVANLTAIANDYGYLEVFSRQLAAIAGKDDVAWGISTSGNSRNVIQGIKKAKDLGLITIAFTGGNGGELKKLADLSFVVPSTNTARIQEVHMTAAHIICKIIEEFFL